MPANVYLLFFLHVFVCTVATIQTIYPCWTLTLSPVCTTICLCTNNWISPQNKFPTNSFGLGDVIRRLECDLQHLSVHFCVEQAILRARCVFGYTFRAKAIKWIAVGHVLISCWLNLSAPVRWHIATVIVFFFCANRKFRHTHSSLTSYSGNESTTR